MFLALLTHTLSFLIMIINNQSLNLEKDGISLDVPYEISLGDLVLKLDLSSLNNNSEKNYCLKLIKLGSLNLETTPSLFM